MPYHLNPWHQQKIALALGGGAARGFAHIGVIDALTEAGYEIEAIAGTSIGAIVSGYYAVGKYDEMKQFVNGITKKGMKYYTDIGLPTRGLVQGKRLCELFVATLDGLKIEDAKIPLYIVATNLFRAERHIFRRAFISEAIRASISVPGVFVPVKMGNEHYVDGYLKDPVPVDVLAEHGYRNIIGVDLNRYLSVEDMPEKDPSILTVLGKSLEILIHQITLDSLRQVPDTNIIRPNLAKIGPLEFSRHKELIRVGYETTMKAIETGRKLPERFETGITA